MCIHPFVHLSMMIPFWCISKSSADVNKLYHPPQYFSTHSTNYSSRFTYVVKSQSRSVVSNSLQPCELHSPWNSPGQNPGVGSLSLLQGIFPTHGSNPGLSHCINLSGTLFHQVLPSVEESEVSGWKVIAIGCFMFSD